MRNWVLWLIVGVVSLVGGIFALANPFAATLAVNTLAGWTFIVVGTLQIFTAFQDAGWGARIWAILLGVLAVVLGVNLIGNPLEGSISLTLVVAIMLLVAGTIRIILAFGLFNSTLRWMMIISGVLSVILGVMILSNFPQSALVTLGLFLAIELISNGVSLIVLSLVRKPEEERLT